MGENACRLVRFSQAKTPTLQMANDVALSCGLTLEQRSALPGEQIEVHVCFDEAGHGEIECPLAEGRQTNEPASVQVREETAVDAVPWRHHYRNELLAKFGAQNIATYPQLIDDFIHRAVKTKLPSFLV